MISVEHKKLLSELKHTQYGVALKIFLESELEELSDITTSKTWQETVGRQKAVRMIRRLFSFMEEKKTTDKTKNQYV